MPAAVPLRAGRRSRRSARMRCRRDVSLRFEASARQAGAPRSRVKLPTSSHVTGLRWTGRHAAKPQPKSGGGGRCLPTDEKCQRIFLMENFVPPCGIGTFHPLAKRKLTKRIPMTFGVWSFGQLRVEGRQTAVVGRSSGLTGGSPLGAPASRRQMRVRQMLVYTTPPAGETSAFALKLRRDRPALPGAAQTRSTQLRSIASRPSTS